MHNKVPGYVSNVHFRKLSLSGKPGPYLVQISGADEKHDVRDVSFQNVEILGSTLGNGSEHLELGQHVTDVQFETQSKSKPSN